jgi:anti-sigma regulatory factor (Ser/Thr protein kinase)
MDISISEGAGYLAVHATGELSLRTVPDLRDSLLKAAAEQPMGLICDLRDARATRESLTILHVVADQVADWPGSPLAVVARDQVLLDQLGRLGLRRRLPVVPDLDQASAALRYSPRFLRVATRLDPTADAPAAARAFTGEHLRRWQVGEAVEPAQWVVSELVTNAVVHAGTELTVRVSLSGRVGVAVGDRGTGRVAPTGAVGADTGWGLVVVEQLTRSWGVLPRVGDGVVVWAVLDVDIPTTRALPQQSTAHA